MKKINLTITTGVLCAVALFALYCTEFERDNPLDPKGTNYQKDGGDTPGATQFAVTFNTNGGTQYTATTPVTKDLALTANYQVPSVTYTLTVNAGGCEAC